MNRIKNGTTALCVTQTALFFPLFCHTWKPQLVPEKHSPETKGDYHLTRFKKMEIVQSSHPHEND